jgi:hypothetical protein
MMKKDHLEYLDVDGKIILKGIDLAQDRGK